LANAPRPGGFGVRRKKGWATYVPHIVSPPLMASVPSNYDDAELEKGSSSQEKVSQQHLDGDSGHDKLERPIEPALVHEGEAPIIEAKARQIKDRDPNVVDWDGDDDPGCERFRFNLSSSLPTSPLLPHLPALGLMGYSRNPLNWPERKKWASMAIVGLMCIVSPFASTLPAPALPRIAEQFGITNSSVTAMCVSVCTS
jgi:hypothetical protein